MKITRRNLLLGAISGAALANKVDQTAALQSEIDALALADGGYVPAATGYIVGEHTCGITINVKA